jgi:hypothetical protein
MRRGRGAFLADAFLWALGLLLAGYALLGRGFSYANVGGVYVGEWVLGLGLVTFAVPRTLRGFRSLFAASVGCQLLLGLMFWGALCTAPHLGEWGKDALRDATLWGYATFGLILASILVAEPDRLHLLLGRYRRFAAFFALLILGVWWVRGATDGLFTFPGAPTAVPGYKAGDVLVHLSGATTSLLLGLFPAAPVAVALLPAAAGIMGASNRGGLVAFLASMALAVIFRPHNRRIWVLAAVAVIEGSLLLLTEAELPFKRGARDVSVEQVVTNLKSVFSASDELGLEGTKAWRLRWWSEIVSYTFQGPHFWTGKGYGISLAADDGFQAKTELRSPHSCHMTFLARSGVPGLALWLAFLAAWAAPLVRTQAQSRRNGDRTWANVLAFVLCFGAAFLVNASFDVYLEGPVGGIWFWVVIGVGLASPLLYRRHPDLLGDRPQGTSSI